MNTRQLAENIGIIPTSIHARFCRFGSYFGLVPEKLPNGQLIWPDDSVDRLKETARKHGAVDKARKAREVRAANIATTAEGVSQGGAV